MTTIVKGQALDLEPVEKFIEGQIQRWKIEHPNVGKWGVFTGSVSFKDVLRFMMDSADDLVVLVEGLVFNGQDKKATVLKSLGTLYDDIIDGALPVWLKPFSSIIKYVIINVVIDKLIDYIVSRYNDGSRIATAMAWKNKIA